MTAYVLRRMAGGVRALLVISALVFIATNLLPGNPAYAILGRDATPAKCDGASPGAQTRSAGLHRYLEWLRV